jgi:hypothetical protein
MQIINTDNGSFRWEESPILTNTQLPTEKNEIQVTDMLPNNSWIFVWDDRGTDSNPDFKQLYINRANYDATVGNKTDAAVNSIEISVNTTFEVVSFAGENAIFAVDVAADTHATITICDVDGTCVATPFEGELAAGRQYIEWNANVPAGIYLATLTTANSVETVKLLVK